MTKAYILSEVYVLVIDWTLNGAHDVELDVFESMGSAKERLRELYEADKKENNFDCCEYDVTSASLYDEGYVQESHIFYSIQTCQIK